MANPLKTVPPFNTLVIAGPSGSGKSTLVNKLMQQFEGFFGFSISHTTRNARNGEINGKHYHFINRTAMEEAIKAGEFIEYTQFSNNYYGTSKRAVKDIHETGKICILDVEIEGVKNLKKMDLKSKFLFIKPPNFDILEQRLRGRGTETEESVQKRLNRAKEEMAFSEANGKHIFDLIIVNDCFDKAYNTLKQFIINNYDVTNNRETAVNTNGEHISSN